MNIGSISRRSARKQGKYIPHRKTVKTILKLTQYIQEYSDLVYTDSIANQFDNAIANQLNTTHSSKNTILNNQTNDTLHNAIPNETHATLKHMFTIPNETLMPHSNIHSQIKQPKPMSNQTRMPHSITNTQNVTNGYQLWYEKSNDTLRNGFLYLSTMEITTMTMTMTLTLHERYEKCKVYWIF